MEVFYMKKGNKLALVAAVAVSASVALAGCNKNNSCSPCAASNPSAPAAMAPAASNPSAANNCQANCNPSCAAGCAAGSGSTGASTATNPGAASK